MPSISRPQVRYTIEELEALELPDNGVRYELVHGQLLVSPSTRKMDLTVKRSAYLEFGVRELWFADPMTEAITVVRPAVADREVRSPDALVWQAPGAAAPVELRLTDIFP